MIAGGRGDHTASADLGSKPRDLVVCATNLEREHRLQVLALEQHAVAQALRKPRREFEWSLDRDVVDAGRQDAFEVVVVALSVQLRVAHRKAPETPNPASEVAGAGSES